MQSDIDPVVKSQMATATSTTPGKAKIPKRIHKSQREKKKREHLNELFLALANSLGLPEQNTCKASVLNEATRLVKDTLARIKHLKEENAALVSESEYVTVEMNELKDENSAFESEIGKLRTEIKSRVSGIQLDLNEIPPENQSQEVAILSTNSRLMFPQNSGQPQGQIIDPSRFSAFCTNIQAYPEFVTEQHYSGYVPEVSKPHARYPTVADTWPYQVLEKQPEPGKGAQDGYRNGNFHPEVRP